jgi:hypothetical protein
MSASMRLPLRSRRARRLTIAGASLFLLLVVAQVLSAPVRPAVREPFPPRWATHMDRKLSRAVDAVAQRRDTVVWCWSVADWKLRRDPWRGREHRWKGLWGGYTLGGAVQLAPNECAVLKLLSTSPAPVREWKHPEALAWSTYVLAHESIHVAGYRSEKKATCWGLQRVSKTALALGRTETDARYLADLAWRHAYRRNPPSYRSPECRDGGRLDLRPKSHIWP